MRSAPLPGMPYNDIPPNDELLKKLKAAVHAAPCDRDRELRAQLIAAIVKGVVVFTVFGVALTLMVMNDAPGWAYWTLVLALMKK